MNRTDIAGIVLAGGSSRRFGSDKLAAEIDGEPLLWRPLRALAGAEIDELIVVVGPDGPQPALPPEVLEELEELVGPEGQRSVRIVRDPEAFGGPLVGLRTGLLAARADRVIVVAGDQPSLRPELLLLLVDPAIAPGSADAVALIDPNGVRRPIPCALHRRRALAAAEELLATDERRLRSLLDRLDVTSIDEATWRPVDPDAGWTRDVDLPEDLPPRD